MSVTGTALVDVQEAVKEYRVGKQIVTALRGVSLTIPAGEFAVIAGPSGSGKTTLLNLIGCMDAPTRGSVKVGGQELSRFSERQRTAFRLRKLGFIFQSFNLVPFLTAQQNVELPLMLQRDLSTAQCRLRATALLEQVGLLEHRRHRPRELSGGQQQRVAIARALVARPALVLADEPTANLDSVTGNQIVALTQELSHREGVTFIFSTHDPKIIEMAERVIEIADGRVLADHAGRSADV
jgi:putative ABC transport system ATP-binding protein